MSDLKKTDLEDLAESLEKHANENERPVSMVSFKDLFTPSFMAKHTQFANFSELLIFGKFNVNSLEEFMALLDDKFDEFVKQTTQFQSWEEMQSTAVAEYVKTLN